MFFESFSHGSMFAEHKNFRLKISSKPDKKISLFISISLFNLKVGDLFSGRSSSKEGSLSSCPWNLFFHRCHEVENFALIGFQSTKSSEKNVVFYKNL